MARIPKPVVAAVTGYALGGGCELALCADIRIAAEDATFGQPEILLGIIPGAGGTQRLTRLVGPSRAKDIIFTGRFVKADEALGIGLVDKVVPADQVYDEAVKWAEQFASAASYAVRAAKEAIDRGLEVDLETGLEIERQQFAASSRPKTVPLAWGRSLRRGRARPTSRDADSLGQDLARPSDDRAQESNVSPKVSTDDPRQRQEQFTAAQSEVRQQAARAVRIIFGVLATILALGAILVVLRDNINAHNTIVKFINDAADAIAGPFSREDGIFHFTGKNAAAKNALLNWGIAAIVYLLIGRFLSNLIAPKCAR